MLDNLQEISGMSNEMACQLSRANSIEKQTFWEERWTEAREFVVVIQEGTVKNFQLTVHRTQVNKI